MKFSRLFLFVIPFFLQSCMTLVFSQFDRIENKKHSISEYAIIKPLNSYEEIQSELGTPDIIEYHSHLDDEYIILFYALPELDIAETDELIRLSMGLSPVSMEHIPLDNQRYLEYHLLNNEIVFANYRDVHAPAKTPKSRSGLLIGACIDALVLSSFTFFDDVNMLVVIFPWMW